MSQGAPPSARPDPWVQPFLTVLEAAAHQRPETSHADIVRLAQIIAAHVHEAVGDAGFWTSPHQHQQLVTWLFHIIDNSPGFDLLFSFDGAMDVLVNQLMAVVPHLDPEGAAKGFAAHLESNRRGQEESPPKPPLSWRFATWSARAEKPVVTQAEPQKPAVALPVALPTISVSEADGRVRVRFTDRPKPGTPEKQAQELLHGHGFRWCRRSPWWRRRRHGCCWGRIHAACRW